MMIDPRIAAAIVTASGGVIETLLKLVGSKEEPTAQAQRVINKTYDELSQAVTTNCVRVLRVLWQVGSKQSEGQIYNLAEPMRQRQEPTGQPFEPLLTYRLRFLCLLGLVRITLDEYAITQLGSAFLARAAGDQANYRLAFV